MSEFLSTFLQKRFAHGPTIAEAFERSMTEGNNFDAIRLFAAMMVLYAHSFLLTLGGNPTDILGRISGGQTGYGDIAIGAFFVLSGFLIAVSWMRRPDLAVFARNRAMRIMPALIVVVLAAVFLIGPAVTTVSLNDYFAAAETWRYLLNIVFYNSHNSLPGVFTGNAQTSGVNGPLWTLQFEAVCYSLIALLGFWRGLTARRCLAMILAFMILSIALGDSISSPAENFLRRLSNMGAWFFGGAFLAATADKVRLNRETATVSAVALVFGMAAGGFSQIFIFAGPYLVVYAGLAWRGPLRHVGRLGDFSYGVYIWSWPIQQTALLHLPSDSPAALIAVSLPATLLIAVLSWRCIEKPALRLKAKSALAILYRRPVLAAPGA